MTTLLTITHDPQGKQLSHFSPLLFFLFDKVFMIATGDTKLNLITRLAQHCTLKLEPQNGMCQARRDVVKLAWESYPMADQYFYCDFDRLLFWWSNFPDELKKVAGMQSEFMVLGRTERAMSTYPALQRETERAMNKIVRVHHSNSLGFDFFAGARLFNPAFSEKMMDCQGEDAVLDIKWPVVAGCSAAIYASYLATEGLAYEAEFLGMTRTPEEETALRTRNLKSILDYMEEI